MLVEGSFCARAAWLAAMAFEANEVVPGLWLGSEDSGLRLDALRERGIACVLIPAYTGAECIRWPEQLHYLQYRVPDVASFPLLPLLDEFVAWITEARTAGHAVLVHCAAGRSRSAAVVMAYCACAVVCRCVRCDVDLRRQ